MKRYDKAKLNKPLTLIEERRWDAYTLAALTGILANPASDGLPIPDLVHNVDYIADKMIEQRRSRLP